MATIIGSGSDDSLINGTNKADSIYGLAGDDEIDAKAGNDQVWGGAGADRIEGDLGDDVLWGDDGNNAGAGGGNDVLIGDAGNDRLYGESGDDTLYGGTGKDTLTGGSGADRFVFSHRRDSDLGDFDTITDFTQGQDKIDLWLIYGANALVWSNTTPAVRGVWHERSGMATTVFVDTNNDGLADMRIVLAGDYALTPDDFIGVQGAAVNTPPVVTVPGAQVISEDSVLVLGGANAIHVTDPDSSLLTVTLTATNGLVTLAQTTGLSFAAGTGTADASMEFTGSAADINAALSGLQFVAPADFSGSASISIGTTDGIATASGVLSIAVEPVSDAPFLVVMPASGEEDTAIALSISAAVSDGSEVLSITIGDVPAGSVLSAGTNLGGGVWALAPAALAGLTITPPPNADSSFVLTVVATSTDGGSVPATTTAMLTVDVIPVNDPASISGIDSGAVVEAGGIGGSIVGTPFATGDLNAADIDNPSDAFQPVNVPAATANGYGTYTVDANGLWVYSLDNSDFVVDALNSASVPLTDYFEVQSADGTAHTVTITIQGLNDAAIISGAVTGIVTEGGASPGVPVAVGTLTASDTDDPDDAFVAVASPQASVNGYGSFTIDAGGQWIFTLDDSHPDVDALDTGESLADSFVVTSIDGTAATVNITILGNSDFVPPATVADRIVTNIGASPMLIPEWVLLWNDSHPNGLPFDVDPGSVVVTSPSDTVSAVAGTGTNGTVTFADLGNGANGNGGSFEYRAIDSLNALSNPAVAVMVVKDRDNVSRLDGSAAGGNAGNDIFIGDDTPGTPTIMVGGDGNDLLLGGFGVDRYEFDLNDGNDLIWDSDGNGRIVITNTAGTVLDTFGAEWTGTTLRVSVGNTVVNVREHYAGRQLDLLNFNASVSYLGLALLSGGSNYVIQTDLTGDNTTSDLIASSAAGETLFGLAGTDLLFGNAGDDVLNGGDNGDFLDGGADNDILNGGTGNDTLHGGAGNDTLDGGADAGSDTLIVSEGVDTMSGGAGNDSISFIRATSGVTFTLNTAGATVDFSPYGLGTTTYSGIESIVGSNHADTLQGDGLANTISAGTGNDVITGASGNDTLAGGGGNDTYVYALNTDRDTITEGGADAGDEIVVMSNGAAMNGLFVYDVNSASGSGDLVIEFLQNTHEVRLSSHFTPGTARVEFLRFDGGGTVHGYALGTDAWLITADDSGDIDGTAGNDLLVAQEITGTALTHGRTMNGGDGNDLMFGGGGDSILRGGAGDDLLIGDYSTGNRFHDVLIGGVGADVLVGGNVSVSFGTLNDGDLFTYLSADDSTAAATDTIVDFTAGLDQIDLVALLGTADLVWGGLVPSTTGSALAAWYRHDAGNTWVQADTSGDGEADLQIRLNGLHTLNVSDFRGVIAAPINGTSANVDRVVTNVSAGTAISIPVAALLANDVDANGDALSLVPGSVVALSGGIATVGVSTVDFTHTTASGQIAYSVTDGTNIASSTIDVSTQPSAFALYGFSLHDQILIGSVGSGATSYRFDGNDGRDQVYDLGGASDSIGFFSVITALEAKRVGDNLVVRASGTEITVHDQFGAGGTHFVESIGFAPGLNTTYGGYALGSNVTFDLSTTGTGGLGNDLLAGSDAGETLNGGGAAATRDVLFGNGGDDTLIATNGSDLLVGGEGNDILIGGNGNNLLIGGEGSDQMSGGTITDTYRYESLAEAQSGTDTITGFSTATIGVGGDVLDIHELLAGFDGVGASPTIAGLVSGGFLQFQGHGSNANTQIAFDSNGSAAGGVTGVLAVLQGIAFTTAANAQTLLADNFAL